MRPPQLRRKYSSGSVHNALLTPGFNEAAAIAAEIPESFISLSSAFPRFNEAAAIAAEIPPSS